MILSGVNDPTPREDRGELGVLFRSVEQARDVLRFHDVVIVNHQDVLSVGRRFQQLARVSDAGNVHVRGVPAHHFDLIEFRAQILARVHQRDCPLDIFFGRHDGDFLRSRDCHVREIGRPARVEQTLSEIPRLPRHLRLVLRVQLAALK